MVDLHRLMRTNETPELHFRKVAPQIVTRLLPQITIVREYSLARTPRRNPFGRI
jgi:hypothetical protein